MKVPFYFDRALALEARAALIDILSDLTLPIDQNKNPSCLDENRDVIPECARNLAVEVCASLDPIKCLEEKFGVVIRSSESEPNLLDDLSYTDYLITEIYEAVLQFAGRLFLECHKQGKCQYASPADMFYQLYSEGSRQVDDRIVFEIISGGTDGAAMYTESTGRIYIYTGGKGMGGYSPGEGGNVGEYANRDTKFITRYLITHELFHILSQRSGFAIHTLSDSFGALFEQVGASIGDVAYQFYLSQEGYNVDQPIVVEGLGEITPLPEGLNNWGTPDEKSVELLNLWLWTGEIKPNMYADSEGNLITDENNIPRPLGFKDVDNLIIQAIEENISTWLRQADY